MRQRRGRKGKGLQVGPPALGSGSGGRGPMDALATMPVLRVFCVQGELRGPSWNGIYHQAWRAGHSD